MNKISGIYAIVNEQNGKMYIGLSKHMDRRYREHVNLLRRGTHHNKHLQHAYNAGSTFTHITIELCSEDKLKEREIYWCDYYNVHDSQFGYNDAPAGGDIPNLIGRDSPCYNHTVYKLYHDEHGVVYSTCNDMIINYNLDDSKIYSVVGGKRFQVKGWRMTKHKPWVNLYTFKHKDGRVEENVQQYEMYEKYKCDSGTICTLTKGSGKSCKGWYFVEQTQYKMNLV